MRRISIASVACQSCIALLAILLLTACIRIASDSEAIASPTPPAPTIEPTNMVDTPAAMETLPPTNPAPTATTPIEPGTPEIPLALPSDLPPLSLNLRWRLDLGGSLTAIDSISLDGGPLLDLIATSKAGELLTRGLNQEEYWREQFTEPANAMIATDLDLDGVGDVIVGHGTRVTAMEGGNVLWGFDALAEITGLLSADRVGIDQTGVFAATADGQVMRLTANGRPIWATPLSPNGVGIKMLDSFSVGPFVSDLIVAVMDDGGLVAVTGQGEIQWQVDTLDSVYQIVPADLDANGQAEIIAVTPESIVAVGQLGEEIGRWQPGSDIRSADVADFDGDGIFELLAGSSSDPGVVTLMDGTQVRWQFALDGGAIQTVAGRDIDGDGLPEIITGDEDGTLSVLDGDGRIRATLRVDDPIDILRVVNMDTSVASPQPELLVQAGSSVYLVDISLQNIDLTPTPQAEATSPIIVEDGVTPSPPMDLPHYELKIALDYAAHKAQVDETVTLSNGSKDEWREIVFNVSAAYWPGIININQVETISDGVVNTSVTALENTMLRVPLPRPLSPGEQVIIHLQFALNLPVLDPVGWGPTGNAGWGPNVVQMGDFYPALIPYEDGRGWRTWQFVPVGDPVISDLADYDVTIDVAPDVMLAAAGFVTRTETGNRYHIERARAFAFVASHNYVRFNGAANGTPIQVYVNSGYPERGLEVLRAATDAVMLFEEWYGPFPYLELVIAQNGFLTSHEYSGFIALGDYVVASFTGGPDSLLHAITAHEVAHQWWYGAVGNDQVNEPWLDEGMAMLSELLYYERYYPELASEWWWEFRVDRWNPTGFVDATIYDFNDSPSFVHDMYGQAAHFMGDLRDTMGESAFRALLWDYSRLNRDQIVTAESFLALARSHSASDLTTLFNMYFRQ